MTAAPGYNPLRWDCLRQGCFNLKRRPKIEVFADCFPGRISFGDVDGIVEIGGNALLLEWKSEPRDLPSGQRLLYQRLTWSGPVAVMIVIGDAETMLVDGTSIFDRGIRYPPDGYEPADLACIKRRLAAWCRWAARHPAVGSPR
ncbi:MAG: hypothetical protein WAS73_13945 [Defluviicoccus sp.]